MTIIELVNELSDIMNVGGEDIEVRVDREFYHSEPLAALMYFDEQNVIRILTPSSVKGMEAYEAGLSCDPEIAANN